MQVDDRKMKDKKMKDRKMEDRKMKDKKILLTEMCSYLVVSLGDRARGVP
jgi:hypothetical protein